ncbi:MAG: Re/Si-specific NAD(P)(+) transhydrogenase subunit alpha [Microscillaceae bacterium]|nr:Re/Si-specific NAD(P)(+) transhydrogenase subunit alpha [Microscillaceae bacterium]
MKIAIPQETTAFEKRVAITPDVVKSLTKSGFICLVETQAGKNAGFTDEAYSQAGAQIVATASELYASAQIVLKINAPTREEVQAMPPATTLISFMYAHTNPDLVEVCLERQITAFAMDAIPRITRAQKMDALSSQANLAGYKAVLLGANYLTKIFPLMMTAAGTIPPAKVLIFGAGVAGLQALATARRLGAVVEVTDVRPETKEEVESLGGRFLEVEGEGVKIEGGYAKEVSADYLLKQRELIKKRIKEADLVITTALVMGKKAPILVTEEMVKSMKSGAVIVDMATASGGNCELSEINQTVVKHQVTIVGEANLPALLAHNASELYARNISAFLLQIADKQGLKLDWNDEITAGAAITYQGEVLNKLTKELMSA